MERLFAEQMAQVAAMRATLVARCAMTADTAAWLDETERAIDAAWREAETAERVERGRLARSGR